MAKLQLNVARKPFFNRRPLNVAVAVVAGGIALVSFFNMYGLFSGLLQHRALGAEIIADATAAAEAAAASKDLEKRLDAREGRRIRVVARTVTEVIRQRQLSWSRLLDQLALVLPNDVRILSVNPTFGENRMSLVMECLAKSDVAKLEFYQRLNQAPFDEGVIVTETYTDDGRISFGIRCFYDPHGVDATAGGTEVSVDTGAAAGGEATERRRTALELPWDERVPTAVGVQQQRGASR